MACGLGKMFGFEFMKNFNYPYVSKTITESFGTDGIFRLVHGFATMFIFHSAATGANYRV